MTEASGAEKVFKAILVRLGLISDDETDDELRERIKAACRESADGPNVRKGER